MMTNELVPQDGRADPITRNDQGLLPAQQQLLVALDETGDLKEAAEKCKFRRDRVWRWLRTDLAFREAYNKMFEANTDIARQQIGILQQKAAQTAEDLLEELKPITKEFECYECGAKNKVTIEVRDAQTRAKITEMLLKGSGALKDIREVKSENITTHMSLADKIALEKHRRGIALGEQSRKRLEALGILDPKTGDIVEG